MNISATLQLSPHYVTAGIAMQLVIHTHEAQSSCSTTPETVHWVRLMLKRPASYYGRMCPCMHACDFLGNTTGTIRAFCTSMAGKELLLHDSHLICTCHQCPLSNNLLGIAIHKPKKGYFTQDFHYPPLIIASEGTSKRRGYIRSSAKVCAAQVMHRQA